MKKLLPCLLLFFCNLLNSKAQNCGQGVTPCDFGVTPGSGTPISTVNGTMITTSLYPPLLPCEISTGDVEFNKISGIVGLSCPTSKYNCHGYAWYTSWSPPAGGTEIWIPNDQISKFWLDKSFYEVYTSPTNVKGVVLYEFGNHSAITIPNSNPVNYISKWGAGYLVRHAPNSVPSSYGKPSRYFLRCGACDLPPNLSRMTTNLGSVSNTVNFITAGGYTLSTNISTCELNANNLIWSSTGNVMNWTTSGTQKASVLFTIAAGQSFTLNCTAANACGSSNRNITFVAQSMYRIASTAQVRDKLQIEFDNTDYLEILPQEIGIFDEKTGREEMKVSVKELF